MLTPVERPSRISTLGITLFIAWLPPKSERLSSTLRCWLWRDIPAGRQADRKFTLPSRFALFFISLITERLQEITWQDFWRSHDPGATVAEIYKAFWAFFGNCEPGLQRI
jgi:hypothetical protein